MSANKPGSQNKNTHQKDSGFANISPIVVPKRNRTKKPTNPDKNLLIGDQNLYKNSDYIMSNGILIGCHQGLSVKQMKYLHQKLEFFLRKSIN